MPFDYEQSIWGRGTASLKWSDPMNIRLSRCLDSIKKLPEGTKILEIGCGAGAFIRAIKKLHPEWECFGADLSREAISAAVSAVDGVSGLGRYIERFWVQRMRFDFFGLNFN